MDPEIFKKTLDNITEKLGEEKAALIADDLGTFKTAQNTALKEREALNSQIKELTTTNSQLIASNANLLQKIPVYEENKVVSNSQTEDINIPTTSPFDEFGRLKK